MGTFLCSRHVLACLAGAIFLTASRLPAQEIARPIFTPKPADLELIREEGLNRSQAMKHLDYLCNVIGPRLTASPALKRANEWSRDQMTSWGMKNAKLEPWGPFGNGWTLKRFAIQVVGSPDGFPVRAYPKAWSPGAGAPFEAPVVFLDATDEAGLEKYKGQIKGKIVLISQPRNITPAFTPPAIRFTEEQLKASETVAPGFPFPAGTLTVRGGRGGGAAPAGGGRGGRGGAATEPVTPPGTQLATQPGGGGRGGRGAGPAAGANFQGRLLAFANEEGAALVLDSATSGDGGIMFVSSASVPAAGGGRGASAWSVNVPKIPAQAMVAIEDYARIVNMLRQGVALKMHVDFQTEFKTDDTMCYNTIAEIPGTDLADQIVMAGAHMDSWHGGTGATDNGAGCAAVLEAARIIMASGLKPRRTIRIALWTGEEQGLLGSRAYVTAHFGGAGRGGRGAPPAEGAAAAAPARGPEFEKLAAYYNLDNGGAYVRGIYGQGNEAALPIFRKWLEPLHDIGATTVTPGSMSQTDHVSFDGVGLPAFHFIQDTLDYFTRTHHSTGDVTSRVPPDELKQVSTVMAVFLWNTANMDERFPRRPAPAAPRGGRGPGGEN